MMTFVLQLPVLPKFEKLEYKKEYSYLLASLQEDNIMDLSYREYDINERIIIIKMKFKENHEFEDGHLSI